MLPLVLPVIAQAHGLFLKRIIHTETQDGKCIVDGPTSRLRPPGNCCWGVRNIYYGKFM